MKFVRLSYLDSNKSCEMKRSLSFSVFLKRQYESWNSTKSVRLTLITIRGMKWNVVCLCYLDPKLWDEMKRSFSVCLSKLDPKIGVETKRSFSVRLSDLDTNKRDKLKHSLSVCLSWIPFWGVKCNVVCISFVYSNWRVKWSEVCPSVFLTLIQIWRMKWRVVCPSDVDSNMMGELKRSSYILRIFKFEGEAKTEVPRDVRNSKVRKQDKFRRKWSQHRTLASPKVGQDQVSGGVSVLCWHAAPVANVLWKHLAIW